MPASGMNCSMGSLHLEGGTDRHPAMGGTVRPHRPSDTARQRLRSSSRWTEGRQCTHNGSGPISRGWPTPRTCLDFKTPVQAPWHNSISMPKLPSTKPLYFMFQSIVGRGAKVLMGISKNHSIFGLITWNHRRDEIGSAAGAFHGADGLFRPFEQICGSGREKRSAGVFAKDRPVGEFSA
jgi:hypothetical protein